MKRNFTEAIINLYKFDATRSLLKFSDSLLERMKKRKCQYITIFFHCFTI